MLANIVKVAETLKLHADIRRVAKMCVTADIISCENLDCMQSHMSIQAVTEIRNVLLDIPYALSGHWKKNNLLTMVWGNAILQCITSKICSNQNTAPAQLRSTEV